MKLVQVRMYLVAIDKLRSVAEEFVWQEREGKTDVKRCICGASWDIRAGGGAEIHDPRCIRAELLGRADHLEDDLKDVIERGAA